MSSARGLGDQVGLEIGRVELVEAGIGVGLMGEAGPEAILPLRRGRNGRLGVEATAAPINVVFNVSTPDAGSFRASQGAILAERNLALRRSQRSI
jgi:phage-related minor tail protein